MNLIAHLNGHLHIHPSDVIVTTILFFGAIGLAYWQTRRN